MASALDEAVVPCEGLSGTTIDLGRGLSLPAGDRHPDRQSDTVHLLDATARGARRHSFLSLDSPGSRWFRESAPDEMTTMTCCDTPKPPHGLAY